MFPSEHVTSAQLHFMMPATTDEQWLPSPLPQDLLFGGILNLSFLTHFFVRRFIGTEISLEDYLVILTYSLYGKCLTPPFYLNLFFFCALKESVPQNSPKVNDEFIFQYCYKLIDLNICDLFENSHVWDPQRRFCFNTIFPCQWPFCI